jgi:DNA polymerase-1
VWDDGIVTTATNLNELKAQVKITVDRWIEKFKTDHVIICFSPKGSKYFRHKIFPDYKQNRKGGKKPLGYNHLVTYMQEEYTTCTIDDCEADDALGILATDGSFDRNTIISIDKDMRTIPCDYYNMDEELTEVISEQFANYMHLFQTLVGDATDNYKGCPGVGPKKAQVILQDDSWDSVVKAFNKAGLSEDEALIQARVARILRADDYNFQTKEISLWNPPQKPTALSVVK